MPEIDWKPSKKQYKAWTYLNDNVTTELFFGGAAGGGKSYLGCAWIIIKCQEYPGSRWVMGRAILKNLKASTLLTLFQICKDWGFQKDVDYNYNLFESKITWTNGSEIYLKDLFTYPSDPEFDSLGSTEYTGAFIDEASQISSKAKNIVMSRIRYKLEEFKTIPKLFIASNPSKNFLYLEFYKPSKNKTLPHYRKFLPALVTDNPYISPHYRENLKKLDKVSKQRLLYGNFEYDDDPSKLMEFDKITDIFTNTFVKKEGSKYMSVDPARFGQDKTVIMIWHGYYVIKVFSYDRTSTEFVEKEIIRLSEEFEVPRSNVVVDEDGVGGGIVDHLHSIKGFVNNSTPMSQGADKNNYQNLKTQCYFKLATLVNEGRIAADFENDTHKELLIEDLEQVKRKDIDKDGKVKLVEKEVIKENIGRSPDFSDCMMMRMYFELIGEFKTLPDIWS